MTMTKLRASGLLAALSLTAFGQAQAQALATFVNASPSATALQRNTGIAVQNMCVHLGTREATPGFSLPAGSPKLDLYLRCNELVQTAAGLNGGQPSRSLALTSDQLLGALQQTSGEELASQGALTTRVSSGQFANISGRLNALRLGTRNAAARGRTASLTPGPIGVPSFADPFAGDRVIEPRTFGGSSLNNGLMNTGWSALEPSSSQRLPRSTSNFLQAGEGSGGSGGGLENQWGWFTEGSYNFGDHDQTAGEDGFDFDAMSGTIGVDYNFGSAVIGVSAGYDKYEADFDTNALVTGGDVEVKGGSGSVFGAWFGPAITIDGIVSYGSLSSDINRTLFIQSNGTCVPACPTQNRSFTGSPDGDYLSAGVSAAYEMVVSSWDLTASLAANYRDVSIDSYSETDSAVGGGLALAYGEQTIESFRSILSLQASRGFSTGFGVVTPNFRAEWHHEFKDEPRTIQASYAAESSLVNKASACVSCFALQTDAADADFGVAGAGVSLAFARRLQAYLYYEALLGVSDYSSNSIALGFRGQF